jgi:hypothetical protein
VGTPCGFNRLDHNSDYGLNELVRHGAITATTRIFVEIAAVSESKILA